MRDSKKFETTFAGKKLTVELSPIASRANGSAIVTYGETVVFATAVMSPIAREAVDYFPLTVDYEEKFYASGRILGSRFLRREGRPSQEAILISRLIDRTIRPLFDSKIRHDVHVVAFTISLDDEQSPDIPAILASSLSILTSNVPWGGPIGAIRVCAIGNKIVLNPTYKEREGAELDLIVSGTGQYINMLEGKGKEVEEETFLNASKTAHEELKKIIVFQNEIQKEVGKEKVTPEIETVPEGAKTLLDKHIKPRLESAVFSTGTHDHALSNLKVEWLESAHEQFPNLTRASASDLFEEAINDIVHNHALNEEKRPDGRGLSDIRPLHAEVGFMPRTHGSGLFFRGDTHILSAVTLGAPGDELLIEGMEIQTKKHFMHHYNFPPFSVGEVGKMGSPGRRAIGHGALAEKALEAVIPDISVFPYTIRVVSETLSSNGSSSMGSVCASSLALMDAGVPILRPVAGIAMGLMMKDERTYKILTDIQGPEDHHGDMDFKVAGTEKGITAVQMDIKVQGVTPEILRDATFDAKRARIHILKTMNECLNAPRAELSRFAPKVITMKIPPDKIRDVIGPGGKVINEIIATFGAQIDIEQNGEIFITGSTKSSVESARDAITSITKEVAVGDTITGKVSRIFDFGAMVEITPRLDGLIHISELANFRVGKVTDIVNVGKIVTAKVVNIDSQGRINLSMKALATNKKQ